MKKINKIFSYLNFGFFLLSQEVKFMSDLKKGELKALMIFEVLASDKKTTVESLKEHVEKFKSEKVVDVYEEDFDDPKEVDNPHPDLDQGYSQVCETKFKVDDYPSLIQLIVTYGPSMVEIEEPRKVELSLKEAQDALNVVAETMYKFLQAGAGGILLQEKETGSK